MDLFTDTLGDIFDSIKEKDAKKAELAARKHIDDFVEKIKQDLI